MIAELNVEYPALTKRPPARDGMVIHEWVDTSMYMGTPAQERYCAAQNGTERKAALRDMPEATVKFIEVAEGEPFFLLPPEDFFDQFPDLEIDETEDGRSRDEVTDPR